MDVLSISSPILSIKPTTRSSFPKSFHQFSSRPLSLKTSLNPHRRASVSAASAKSPGIFELPQFDGSLHVTATQTQTDSRRASVDSMAFLLGERTVFLCSEIDDPVADIIISQLLLLDAQDPTKDIKLFVNSYGGSMSATLAIYDVIQLVRADVSTVGLGMVASTAAFILGGGTKGKRLSMPNTRFMIHQPYGGASGQAAAVEVQARELSTTKDNTIRIISEFTGRPLDEIKEFIDVEQYMSAVDAMEFGIVDGVIDIESSVLLEPVPENVKPSMNYEDRIKPDPEKFFAPDIPDDEI